MVATHDTHPTARLTAAFCHIGPQAYREQTVAFGCMATVYCQASKLAPCAAHSLRPEAPKPHLNAHAQGLGNYEQAQMHYQYKIAKAAELGEAMGRKHACYDIDYPEVC